MPQRPEDYMSGKNVGGNRKGGTDARTNDPFDYLKGAITKDHSYLGHFKQDKFLRAGHNDVDIRPRVPGSPTVPSISDPLPPPPGTQVPAARTLASTPSIAPPLPPAAAAGGGGVPTRRQIERPVTTARRELRGSVRSARLAGRAGVLEARATGGDVAAARAERRAGVREARQTRRATIQTAYASPESHRSEVAAARGARREVRGERRAGQLLQKAARISARASRLAGR